MILWRIIIRSIYVVWIPHLTLHSYVFYLLRDAFPMGVLLVITCSHIIMVLENGERLS